MDVPLPRELARLRDEVAAPGPSFTLLSGPRGTDRTRLLRQLVRTERAAVYYRALPLPDPDHRRGLAGHLTEWGGGDVAFSGLDWEEMMVAVADLVADTRRRLVLILDDAHNLQESRSRFTSFLAGGWGSVRARSLPVHLVLAGPSPELESALSEGGDPLGPFVTLHLQLEALDFQQLAGLLGAWSPRDRLMAWTVFGGRPHRLRHLHSRAGLGTNLRRLVLDPEGPLFRAGLIELEGATSSPARYAGLLRAVAGGATEWGAIVRETAGVESGGQMAPYLARLEDLGWITAERSLDAGPRSRKRRYGLTDPFLALWYEFVLPNVSLIEAGRGEEVWSQHVQPALPLHAARLFPAIARAWLARYADRQLPSAAREVGGLWGRGYDLDVAGTLRTGPVAYGMTHWGDAPLEARADDELMRQVRSTRYGFGREARLRLLFSTGGFAPELVRRAARDPLLHLVGPDELLDAKGAPRPPGA